MAAHRLLGFLVLLCCFLLLLSAANATEYRGKCPRYFSCGVQKEIYFPFTNTSLECGLPIRGCDKPDGHKEVLMGNQRWHPIERIVQENNTIFIHDSDFQYLLHYKHCNAFNYSITPPGPPMMSFSIVNSIPFFICHKPVYENMYAYTGCPSIGTIYFSSENHPPIIDDKFPGFSDECSVTYLPVGPSPISGDPFTFLIFEFQIEVTISKGCQDCYVRGGQCLLDKDKVQCVNDYEHEGGDSKVTITELKGGDSKVKIIGLSIGLACMTTIALFAIVLLLYNRRHNSSGHQNQPRNIYTSPHSNTTNPESRTVYFGVPVFSYEELQEATNNFDQARELGEGGFGTVYYGNLRDGREVAVKRLYKRNYRPVESFINEIQILTRLRHRNLVSLYGCTSRHSRELLLVYEYIPNGTVSCHLHGDQAKPGLLPWPVRMKIAIETASALTYLHASDIIHRDVKTSNILLDDNFCVKVADFGLSRLFPNDATHVSTAPRGTPGYVDPDYRLCYQLTSKSDVYSFGVVLVELISSLPAVDVTRDRDEIKLANLAIRKIQKRAFCELVDPSLGFQSDDKIKRRITSVAKLAFQCLQGDKELRPSMAEVLEMLERIESGKNEPGNLEGIDAHGAQVSHSYVHPSLQNTQMKPQRLHQTL